MTRLFRSPRRISAPQLRLRRTAVLLVAAVLLSSCSQATPWAARVNGETISVETIENELLAVTSNPRYSAALDGELGAGSEGGGLRPGGPNTVNASFTAQSLSNRVLVTLMEQRAEADGVEVTAEQRAAAEQQVRGQNEDPAVFDSLAGDYRRYLVDRQALLAALLAARATPEALRRAYDADPGKYATSCVRHILVGTGDAASAIRSRIAGGENFADIARAESLDNQDPGGSAGQGGDLGCFTRAQTEQFVGPFRDAINSLSQGELSLPVATQFGSHIVQITSVRRPTYEEAQTDIGQELGNAASLFTEVLATADVEVDPRYGTFRPADEASGRSAGIEPPNAFALPDKRPSDEVAPGLDMSQNPLG